MYNWQSLNDMYSSDEYDMFIGSKLGNDLFINDPERAERLQEAIEYGAGGSYHAETIGDWQEFLDLQRVFDPEYDEPEDMDSFDLTAEQYNAIAKEIKQCYDWHEKNGSLFEQRG